MKKKRFNETEIIQILQEHEAGISQSDLSRKYGIVVQLIRLACQ